MTESDLAGAGTGWTRRRLLAASAALGSCAAMRLAFGGSARAAEATADESALRAMASHVMVVATEYSLSLGRFNPLVQWELKQAIQTRSKNRIYVDLQPDGAQGWASKLASKVRNGAIQGAAHSISNLSPFCPAVDLLNIPYWANTNQRFVNLIKSDPWGQHVERQVKAQGFEILFYIVLDPRTVSVRRGKGVVVRRPDDIKGWRFRIPNSKILRTFYESVGAQPVTIPWDKTAQAMKEGQADALDPSLAGLWAGGVRDVLESVSFIRSVQDANLYTMNKAWFDGLPEVLRQAIREGANDAFLANLKAVETARSAVMAEMGKLGVAFHRLTDEDLAAWQAVAGSENPRWTPVKRNLAGNLARFDELREATDIPANLAVSDV